MKTAFCLILGIATLLIPVVAQCEEPNADQAQAKAPEPKPSDPGPTGTKAEPELGKWEGFRGIRWGTKIDMISDLAEEPRISLGEIAPPGVDMRTYRRTTDRLRIGISDLAGIFYLFCDGALRAVMIATENKANFDGLKAALIERYGKPEQENPFIEAYQWEYVPLGDIDSAVVIRLTYNEIDSRGFCNMFSGAMILDVLTAQQKAAKKAAEEDF